MPNQPLSPDSLRGLMRRKNRPKGGIGETLVKRQLKKRSLKKRLSDALGAKLIGRSKVTGQY